jgi:peptide/nickel transport system ATP-binding protein
MIFQEPATSLNPVMTVGDQIGEVLVRHRGLRGQPAWDEAERLLTAVSIRSAAGCRISLPAFGRHEAAGHDRHCPGRRSEGADCRRTDHGARRDDPAQVLDLLARLQASRGMGMLLITHDLGVVARMAIGSA